MLAQRVRTTRGRPVPAHGTAASKRREQQARDDFKQLGWWSLVCVCMSMTDTSSRIDISPGPGPVFQALCCYRLVYLTR